MVEKNKIKNFERFKREQYLNSLKPEEVKELAHNWVNWGDFFIGMYVIILILLICMVIVHAYSENRVDTDRDQLGEIYGKHICPKNEYLFAEYARDHQTKAFKTIITYCKNKTVIWTIN